MPNNFEKFIAKALVNKMKQAKDPALQLYAVTATDTQYNICLRDQVGVEPLPVSALLLLI